VVAPSAPHLSKIAVDSVLKVVDDLETTTNVDLARIRVCQRLGGTLDDCELCDGLLLPQNKISKLAGGPTRVKDAKVGLIQFCLSSPKTDLENNVVVKNYMEMDRVLREERQIAARMVKHIAKTGCNVLLIQKSILRDAVTELALDYLAKAKILVIRDIERTDIEYITECVGCMPASTLEQFTTAKLEYCDEVYMQELGGDLGGVARLQGLKTTSNNVSILCRGSNPLILAESARSIHDALCVVRCLVKNRALLPGGGAPEMEISQKLMEWAKTLGGKDSMVVNAYAEAFEIIPYTLAENSGLNALEIVTQLRKAHVEGQAHAGINVVKARISNVFEENCVQPLTVSSSIVKMATECVRMIMKIDDIVMTR
jgi:T-complex protein 1 subunit delta